MKILKKKKTKIEEKYDIISYSNKNSREKEIEEASFVSA